MVSQMRFKTIFLVIVMVALACFETEAAYGQFVCGCDHHTSASPSMLRYPPNQDETIVYDYIPDENDEIITIRVVIHYILHEENHPNYPGNFLPVSPQQNYYSGYDYAEHANRVANEMLANNMKMKLPIGNNTEVRDPKYRIQISGVMFHNSDTYYHSQNPAGGGFLGDIFPVNLYECINVYFHGPKDNSSGYSPVGGMYYHVSDTWERYNKDWIDIYQNGNPDNINAEWGFHAASIAHNHELGHCLSLFHTVQNGSGTEDYCSDTPSWAAMMAENNYSPTPVWGDPSIYVSNNMMDYSGLWAITPIQMGRMYWYLQNRLPGVIGGTYQNSQALVYPTDERFRSIIARQITVPHDSSISLEAGESIYANCRSFAINGSFEMEQGSVLQVNIEGLNWED